MTADREGPPGCLDLTTAAHRAKVLLSDRDAAMSDGLPFQAGKFLIIVGIVFVVLGLLLMAGAKLSFLGRLPGDIAYKGKNVTFYFPIVTCLVLSVVLTLVFWVVSFLTKR
jgi:predicted Co/Zn/Cd cation transporter (cation efflux family)